MTEISVLLIVSLSSRALKHLLWMELLGFFLKLETITLVRILVNINLSCGGNLRGEVNVSRIWLVFCIIPPTFWGENFILVSEVWNGVP